MEKISWTDRVRNEQVLDGVKEKRNILRTIERREANWSLLHRHCLQKHVIFKKDGKGCKTKKKT